MIDLSGPKALHLGQPSEAVVIDRTETKAFHPSRPPDIVIERTGSNPIHSRAPRLSAPSHP